MLSDTSTATVRATLPAVGAAVGDIADLFYRKLFDAHPELLRDLFNRGNQASGTQRRALAGSIAAFATHLVEHPGTRPDVMLGRIANKHASLGITAPQYAIVHTHLFAAITEVLGDAVTPEVAAAWDEVYWLMANALIAFEERLYAQRDVTAGDVWHEWTVTSRTEDTPDVATFTITPADGTPAPAFRSGQYVSVQVELPDGARQIRQYSLTGAPGPGPRSFSVKRVRGAEGPEGEVSAHLHARLHAGGRLRVSAPYGDLVLDDSDAPCSWHRPVSAAPRSCRCWSTWPRRVTVRPSPWCTVTGRPPTTRCAPVTGHSPPASPAARPTSGTRPRSPDTPPSAPGGSIWADWRSLRAPTPTSAARCPSCARSAPSSWTGASLRPTSTTRCSAPISGSPRTEHNASWPRTECPDRVAHDTNSARTGLPEPPVPVQALYGHTLHPYRRSRPCPHRCPRAASSRP